MSRQPLATAPPQMDENDSQEVDQAADETIGAKSEAIGSSRDTQCLRLEEQVGDIFDAPENSVLIHACNCEGSWGAGIAAAFRKQYPEAFKLYEAHCEESTMAQLRGTAYLIQPCEDDSSRKHFVGCLFTSGGRGKIKDKPDAILERTVPAMRDLMQQIASVRSDAEIAEIRMCQINSGLFKVPWKKTKAALDGIELESENWPSTITVYSRD